jgi:hypothetical protein
VPGEPCCQCDNDIVATDDPRERCGQIATRRRAVWRDGCRGRMLAHYRCDKGVTSAGVVRDIAPAGAVIAERLAQRRNMDPQGTVIDDSIGPGVGDQLFLGDRFAGVLDQCDQNVERTTTEAQRLPVVKQHSLRSDQPE